MIINPTPRDPIRLDTAQHNDPVVAARRSNRRRLGVFLTVFTLALAAGLIWNFTRPAEYRTVARAQISTGTTTVRAEPGEPGIAAVEPPAARGDLLTQAQILTSRPVLDVVHQRLLRERQTDSTAEADPVAALQKTLVATPILGTDIVELQATGATPELLARTANTALAVYRDHLFAHHGNASEDALANQLNEVVQLDRTIAKKRAQLAAYRARSGVVSSERNENDALAHIKGLSESLSKASEDAARAEARLRVVRDSAASGRSPVFARDNPTLADIEQRLSATREELRDMERNYTAQYMALDPAARSLRARLTELERQLTTTRSSSQQAALAAAEEEAASTRATAERLRKQVDAQRGVAVTFSGKFNEALTLEEDLRRIEDTRRSASERLAQLRSTENARRPSFTLIEAARVPQHPWRPDYTRDGLIVLAGAFLLGLLAMWFVELFNRAPAPVQVGTTVVLPQHWLAPGAGALLPQAVPLATTYRDVPQLPAKAALPPPLTQDEVRALLAAADGQGRVLCALMLLGLTVDELKDLAFKDIDRMTSRLTVRGASARVVTLPDWLARILQNAGDDPDKPLLRNALGRPFGAADIAAQITCSALDAGLTASVSPETLRHTYLVNLMRQNVRFSDLPPLAGNLSPHELEACAALSSGPRQERGAAVDPIMPALRELRLS